MKNSFLLAFYSDNQSFNTTASVVREQHKQSSCVSKNRSTSKNEQRAVERLSSHECSSREGDRIMLLYNVKTLLALSESINNESFTTASLHSSSSTNTSNKFDPVQALSNPKLIPQQILAKCRQMLLSGSPIITKTCWNRRFGGVSDLCQKAVQLLVHADLLFEGDYAANAIKSYISWIKKLPTDPTDITTTLNFQQNKLDIFGITWEQYASSFKKIEFGHNNSSTLVSKEGAGILRSKPYQDVGFILDESIVSTKKNKSNVLDNFYKGRNQLYLDSEASTKVATANDSIINESVLSVSMMSVGKLFV